MTVQQLTKLSQEYWSSAARICTTKITIIILKLTIGTIANISHQKVWISDLNLSLRILVGKFCESVVTIYVDTSDDSIYQKYRYIVFDIDISFSISIYRIVSSKKQRIFRYITILFYNIKIFLIYRDILHQKFIFFITASPK